MFLKNGGLCPFGKKIEVDFDRSEFDRFLAFVHQQGHFAKVITALPVTPDDLEANPAAIKIFESGGHVMLMQEQRFIRLGDANTIDLLQWRQGMIVAPIEFIEGISESKGVGSHSDGGDLVYWQTSRHSGRCNVRAKKIRA